MPNITDVLSNEEKQQILSQRIKSWASDAYAHELNKEAILAADNKADTAQIDEALATLQTAYESATSKLSVIETAIAAKVAAEEAAKVDVPVEGEVVTPSK